MLSSIPVLAFVTRIIENKNHSLETFAAYINSVQSKRVGLNLIQLNTNKKFGSFLFDVKSHETLDPFLFRIKIGVDDFNVVTCAFTHKRFLCPKQEDFIHLFRSEKHVLIPFPKRIQQESLIRIESMKLSQSGSHLYLILFPDKGNKNFFYIYDVEECLKNPKTAPLYFNESLDTRKLIDVSKDGKRSLIKSCAFGHYLTDNFCKYNLRNIEFFIAQRGKPHRFRMDPSGKHLLHYSGDRTSGTQENRYMNLIDVDSELMTHQFKLPPITAINDPATDRTHGTQVNSVNSVDDRRSLKSQLGDDPLARYAKLRFIKDDLLSMFCVKFQQSGMNSDDYTTNYNVSTIKLDKDQSTIKIDYIGESAKKILTFSNQNKPSLHSKIFE